MKKSMKVLAAAGAFALVPSLASAFSGIYVTCDPTDGLKSSVFISKGLDCSEKTNKLKLSVGDKTSNAINGCDAVSGGAPWDVWSLGKWGSKITQAAAASISKAEVKAKGTAFASCNLSGVGNSAGANMSGSVTFKDNASEKVKGGKGAFVARVGADLPTSSAALNGIMSKGFGIGGYIRIQVGLDLAAPVNQNILACNTGFLCPPDFPEGVAVEELALETLSSSHLTIGNPTDSDCTSSGNPFDCCTGVGTGSCDHDGE